MLKKYNATVQSCSHSTETCIDFQTACDPASPVFCQNLQETEAAIPLPVKRKAIDFFLMAQRSKEEVALVAQEMKQTVAYYNELQNWLRSIVDDIACQGLLSIAKQQLFVLTTSMIPSLHRLFSPFVVLNDAEGGPSDPNGVTLLKNICVDNAYDADYGHLK